MLIYIVEDEERIRNLESYALEKNGFEVMSFADSGGFYQAMDDRAPDLILLDIMLPGDDGLTILKKLRSSSEYDNIPVIIISAKTTELDRVKGLDLGADDYLCKPFGVLEMVSRVNARLRGAAREESGQFLFEEIMMKEQTRTVTAGVQTIDLTYKEFELLKMFMEKPRIVLRRDEILDRIWGTESTGRTLDVHIRSLRAKLGEFGRYIMTVRNVGYKLDKEA